MIETLKGLEIYALFSQADKDTLIGVSDAQTAPDMLILSQKLNEVIEQINKLTK